MIVIMGKDFEDLGKDFQNLGEEIKILGKIFTPEGATATSPRPPFSS